VCSNGTGTNGLLCYRCKFIFGFYYKIICVYTRHSDEV